MKTFLFAWITLLFFHSCGSGEQKTDWVLADFYHLDEVDSIIVKNNSGTHRLNTEKQNKFIKELGTATLDRGSYKLGMIGFSMYIGGNKIHFDASTHGDYLETNPNGFTKNKDQVEPGWATFKTEGFNLDNY